MKKALLCASLLVISATPAMADFGIDLGIGTAAQETSASNGRKITDGDDQAISVHASYQFIPFVGLELGFTDYGETNDNVNIGNNQVSNYKVSTKSIDAGIKGSLPVAPFMSLFAKAGISAWDWEANVTTNSVSTPSTSISKIDDTGQDIYYGIGAQFSFTLLRAGIQYRVIELDLDSKNVKGKNDIDMLSVYAGLSF